MKKLLAIAILLSTSVAAAESLEERKYWKGETDYLNRSLDAASKTCGVSFTWEWVDKPKLRTETEKTNHSPSGVCDQVTHEVDMICRMGDDEKSSVKTKIKGFRCGYAKERSITLKKGIVTYLGNNVQANWTDWARPLLLKAL